MGYQNPSRVRIGVQVGESGAQTWGRLNRKTEMWGKGSWWAWETSYKWIYQKSKYIKDNGNQVCHC